MNRVFAERKFVMDFGYVRGIKISATKSQQM